MIDCASWADGDLARQVSAGAPGAAAAEAELCRRFARPVRLYGQRHLRDRSAADDLVQRVLLLVLEKLRRAEVREPDRLGSFVLGVARMLVHQIRRGPTEVTVSDEGADLPPLPPAEPDLFAAAHLARCLEALAERERTVVVMTYYGEARSAEIASALAVTEGHVRVLRHRAIGRLRECLGLEDFS